jgi:sn-glycerol 3-phosphate transport system substrate-binding protein
VYRRHVPPTILAAVVIRTLALSFALCSAAQAAVEVRVWHTLDAAMASQLAHHVADYNAQQHEFRVRLEPLGGAVTTHLVRLPLPLNTARPVLYYNEDAFRRAHLSPPKTWYEMAPVLGALADAGFACPYTTAWPAWVMLDNSGGTLSREVMVRWSSLLASWEKAGLFSYAGRANEAEARFTAGECAVITSSSNSARDLAKRAQFQLGVAPLPDYDEANAAARPLPAPAPVVWVERQSVGVTNFLAFLAARAAEARRERELLETELEAVWRGEKTAPQALESYSRGLKP